MSNTYVHSIGKRALYSYKKFVNPIKKVFPKTPDLVSRGNRPLQMTFEAINTRGLEQLTCVFKELEIQASQVLPCKHTEFGDLVAIDSSLINAVLSMHWADYRDDSKKAKVHVGFDINHSIPSKIFLADGKSAERPFADQILNPGQTGIIDCGYQSYKDFDRWQNEEKYFVCRIKENAKKTKPASILGFIRFTWVVNSDQPLFICKNLTGHY